MTDGEQAIVDALHELTDAVRALTAHLARPIIHVDPAIYPEHPLPSIQQEDR